MTRDLHVTTHALKRYIERVLGFDFGPFDRRGIPDYLAVSIACEQLAIDEHFVEAQIRLDVEPRVSALSRLRGSRRVVKGERGKYVVEGGVYVTTVLCHEMRVS